MVFPKSTNGDALKYIDGIGVGWYGLYIRICTTYDIIGIAAFSYNRYISFKNTAIYDFYK
jgi:hypothetical protein